jgi:hypothetical protein
MKRKVRNAAGRQHVAAGRMSKNDSGRRLRSSTVQKIVVETRRYGCVLSSYQNSSCSLR